MTTMVFNDFIHSAGATAAAVSDPAQNDLLGSYDQLAIEAVVSEVRAATGPASLRIQIMHSGDGMHWIPKAALPEVAVPSTLSLEGLTYMDIGYDDGDLPTLGFVRLELKLSAVGGPIRAHVRIHVTANDLREREFSADVARARGSYPYQLYDITYPAGSHIAMWRIRDLLGYWQYRGELQVDFQDGSAIVPKDQMVCFNAVGDYILVVGGKVVWSSRLFRDQVLEGSGQGPPKTPNDPKGGWTLGSKQWIEWKKGLGIVPGQGAGHDDD